MNNRYVLEVGRKYKKLVPKHESILYLYPILSNIVSNSSSVVVVCFLVLLFNVKDTAVLELLLEFWNRVH